MFVCSSGLAGIGLKPGGVQTPVSDGIGGAAADCQAEERASLCALKALVAHACEVLGLWKILTEHQLHIIANMLDKVWCRISGETSS